MSDATPRAQRSARREFTLNFGRGNEITFALEANPQDPCAVWAGDMGDGHHAFIVGGDEAQELFEFLADIVDELRRAGRL